MALRHLFQSIDFFREATRYLSPDENGVSQAGENARKHVSVHRIIVAVSAFFGLVGAGLGIGVLVLAAGDKVAAKDLGKLLLAPPMFAIMGIVFGLVVTCLFAPRDFLSGPVGQKWMKLVGTESVVVARIVCFLCLMPYVAFLVLVIWAAWRPGPAG